MERLMKSRFDRVSLLNGIFILQLYNVLLKTKVQNTPDADAIQPAVLGCGRTQGLGELTPNSPTSIRIEIMTDFKVYFLYF